MIMPLTCRGYCPALTYISTGLKTPMKRSCKNSKSSSEVDDDLRLGLRYRHGLHTTICILPWHVTLLRARRPSRGGVEIFVLASHSPDVVGGLEFSVPCVRHPSEWPVRSGVSTSPRGCRYACRTQGSHILVCTRSSLDFTTPPARQHTCYLKDAPSSLEKPRPPQN